MAVVFFVSRARGEAKEGRDWGALVIAKDLPERQIERYRKTKYPPAKLARSDLCPGKNPRRVRGCAATALSGDRPRRADSIRSPKLCRNSIAKISPSNPVQRSKAMILSGSGEDFQDLACR